MVVHYEYCPQCGRKLADRNSGEDGMIPYCDSCQKFWFDSFDSCVIILTYNEFNEIVMTRQPHLTNEHWVYTSGFINPGESAEHAAIREVKEELGLDILSVENAGTYWFAKGGMLMHAFIGYAKKRDFTLSEEVEEAVWVDVRKAAELAGPVRPNVADFSMMANFAKSHNVCDPDELWPGQKIE